MPAVFPEVMKIVEAEMKTLWKDPLKEEILFETALIRVMEELLKDKEALAGIVRSESELRNRHCPGEVGGSPSARWSGGESLTSPKSTRR